VLITGKSQNLQLYSLLINSDASLFTNLKLHLLAILRVIVADVTSTAAITPPEGDDGGGDEDGNADPAVDLQAVVVAADNFKALPNSSSIDTIIQFFIYWLRLCPVDVINDAGTTVCTYFHRLLELYPLYTLNANGSNAAVTRIMTAFAEWSRENPALADQLKYYSDKAGKSLFLSGEGTPILYSDANAYSECVINDRSALPHLFESENVLQDFLHQVASLTPALLYHRLLADEGLVASKWREYMDNIRASAEQLKALSPAAVMCVFIDELNTGGCIGMLSEAFLSHSVDGNPLPDNIFFCGAVNPYRPSSAAVARVAMDSNFTASNVGEKRQEDEAEDYLAGVPYVVKPLPPSMDRLKMLYPTLSLEAEKCFVRDYVAMHIAMPAPPNGMSIEVWEKRLSKAAFIAMAVKLIVKAQDIVRSYHDHIPRVYMSIRNLIRAVHMLSWLLKFDVATENDPRDGSPKSLVNIFLPPAPDHDLSASVLDNFLADTQHRMRTALVMAVTTVYMLQLPSSGHVAAKRAKVDLRLGFLREITQTWRNDSWGSQDCSMTVDCWNGIIFSSWSHLWRYATIPRGKYFVFVLLWVISCLTLLLTQELRPLAH
jgi:hypothetical protein